MISFEVSRIFNQEYKFKVLTFFTLVYKKATSLETLNLVAKGLTKDGNSRTLSSRLMDN